MRWLGMLVALAACHDPPPPAPPPPPPADAAPADAARPAPPVAAAPVERFALFEHVGIATVKLDLTHPVQLPPGTVSRVALSGVREVGGTTRAADAKVAIPPWMANHLGTTRVDRVLHDADGTWFVILGQTLIVVGADHVPELGLDFSEVRNTFTPNENTEIFEGGDHATTGLFLAIRHVHRAGPLLVIATTLSDRLHDLLIGVDAPTGRIVWAAPADTGLADFTLVGGHAITSARTAGRWHLAAIAVDSGKVDATAPLKTGPYGISTGSAAGELSGLLPDKPSTLTATVTVTPAP